MANEVTYANLQSRLFLRGLAEKQRYSSAKLSRPVEAFLQWYERRVLRVDISHIKVERPVFLIGMPRSGTTMMQDLLCAHPGMAYFDNTMNRYPTTFCAMDHFRRLLRLDFQAERFLQDSVNVSPSSPSDGIAVWEKWLKLDPMSLEYRHIVIADFSPSERQAIYDTIRKVIWCHGDPKKRLFNALRASLPHLELVQDLFPDAKFVYILRDARMTANSLIKLCRLDMERQKKAGEIPGDRPFIPYPRFPKLAEYVEKYGPLDIRTTANLWNDAVTYIDQVSPRLTHFHQVRFEDMLADPLGEVSRILEFCELSPLEEKDKAVWEKIGGVGKIHHVNKYEGYDQIEEICRDNLAKHGYLNETPSAARP
jgi:hypothetical protein